MAKGKIPPRTPRKPVEADPCTLDQAKATRRVAFSDAARALEVEAELLSQQAYDEAMGVEDRSRFHLTPGIYRKAAILVRKLE